MSADNDDNEKPELLATHYMGFREQSKEATRLAVQVLSQNAPEGALVIIAGGNRCGKTKLLLPSDVYGETDSPDDIPRLIFPEGDIIKHLKNNGIQPHVFDDPEQALKMFGDNVRGQVIMFNGGDELGTSMADHVKIDDQGNITDIKTFDALLELKKKGAKIIIGMGLHSNIVVAPNDLDDIGREKYDHRIKILTALVKRLMKEPGTHLLHLERSKKEVFDAIKKVARSDEYRGLPELSEDEHMKQLIDTGMPPNDRMTFRGECFGRALPMNCDGKMIISLLELLGQKEPDGNTWSKSAEEQAKKLFTGKYFRPFILNDNELARPKEKGF